jgi:predicted GNAT family N-acyltransferase
MGNYVINTVAGGDQAALDACFAVRRIVFCEEQGVSPALEWDGLDDSCAHFIAVDSGAAVGTARVRHYDAGIGKIERVAVLAAERRRGIGRALMETAILHLREQGLKEVILNAQISVRDFYAGLGFAGEGAEFMEADIPHIRMRLSLEN